MNNSAFFKNRWLTESILYATYMVFGISWASGGALMPQIRQSLAIDFTQSSFITTSVTIAKIIGAFAVAWLLPRMGLYKTFILGSALISISFFSGAVDNFYFLLVIRFVMGLGGAICLVCLVPVVQGLFARERWASINGFNGTSNVIGAIIALTFSNLVSTWLGWREILSLWGGVSLVVMLLWILFAKNVEGNPEEANSEQSGNSISNKTSVIRTALRSRYTWGMILFYVFIINYSISSFAYFPTYFQQYLHFGKSDLGAYAPSFIDAGLLVGCLTGAKVLGGVQKLKPVLIMVLVACVILGAASLTVTSQAIIVVLAALSGYVIGSILPNFLSIATTMPNTTPQLTGTVMSIFWLFTFTISSLNTWIMGRLADAFGGFGYSFGYMFALVIISIIGVAVLPSKLKLSQEVES